MLEKQDILSMTQEELEATMQEMKEPKFRAKQIFSWLHEKKVVSFSEMTTLSLQLRSKLEEYFYIKRLNIVKRLASHIDNTVKYLYELPDGGYVETVCMSYHHGRSLCISTQLGCRMGCNFCASTLAGFERNLTPSELLLQIYETERDLQERIDSIVLMGIGEPFDNFDNVLKFFRLVSAPTGHNLSLRHVTVSTCGLVPKIYELAKEHLGVTLSVSLHAADNETRSKIMPVNRSYPIEKLLEACKNYFAETGRRVTMEYSVIDGVNCTETHAQNLAKILRPLHCHVNLIPINPVKERNYHTARKNVEQFQKRLEQLGIHATIRRTLGSDIEAACGQLRRDRNAQTEVSV